MPTQVKEDLLVQLKSLGPIAMVVVLVIGSLVAYGKSLSSLEAVINRLNDQAQRIGIVEIKATDLDKRVSVLDEMLKNGFDQNKVDHKAIKDLLMILTSHKTIMPAKDE